MHTNMEIVLQQVSYHCSLTDILNMRTVSTFMKTLISECIYTHIIVKFNNVVNNYQLFKCFQSLKCKTNITDNELQYLRKCYDSKKRISFISVNKLQINT